MASIDLEKMLAKIKNSQWALADIDWEAARITVSGYWVSISLRTRFRKACVAGRFSQFVPSCWYRYGTASSRNPSMPRSSQKRKAASISSWTAGFS